jgi:integrase
MAHAPRPRTKADGSTVYDAYLKHEGKQHFLGTRDTREKAQYLIDDFAAKARERERRIAAGAKDVAPLIALTFKRAVEAWLKYLENPAIDGAHRSRSKYESQMRLHMLEVFGNRPIDAITADEIDEWLLSLTTKESQQIGRKKRKLTPQTANTIRICLSSFFTWCVKKRWLVVNPVGATETLSEGKKRDFQWIHSLDEVTAMLAAIDDGDARDFVGLLVGTGMRRGEMLALHWSDVDLHHRQILVCAGGRSKESPHEIKPTKTEETRIVPLLDAALAILKARKLRTGGKGFVFASPRTGGIRNEGPFVDAFKRAVRVSGIERWGKSKLRVHDLRHTFACHWVTSGGDIYLLSKILGHATVKTTEKFYARFGTESYAPHYHRLNFHMPATDATVTQLRAV